MSKQRIDAADQMRVAHMRLATAALARREPRVALPSKTQEGSWAFGLLCVSLVTAALVVTMFVFGVSQAPESRSPAGVSDASRMLRFGNESSRAGSGRLLLTFVRTSKSRPAVASAREAMKASKQNAISAALNCLDPSKRRHVSIDAGALSGGSAGLMLALTIVDAVEPLNIAGEIAGTGTITPNGGVGPIGEIGLKARAAHDARVAMFLAPKAQAAEAARSAPGLRVVGVDSLDQAIRSLGRTEGCSEVNGGKR